MFEFIFPNKIYSTVQDSDHNRLETIQINLSEKRLVKEITAREIFVKFIPVNIFPTCTG